MDETNSLQQIAADTAMLEHRLSDLHLFLPRLEDDILARAAELIDQEIEPRAALDEAFGSIVREVAAAIAQDLEELMTQLRAAARDVSASAGWIAETPDDHSRASHFVDIPVPALPVGLHVPTRSLERLLGHGLARPILTTRLKHAVGSSVRSTLENYAAGLRRWAFDHLSEIRMEWASVTDPLDAYLGGQAGPDQGPSADTRDIEEDLYELRTTRTRRDAEHLEASREGLDTLAVGHRARRP